MGKVSEFVAVTIIDTTLDGLPGTFSNAKSIFKPLLSNAVMEGKPIQRDDKLHFRASLIDWKLYYSQGCFAIYFSRLKIIVTTFCAFWIKTLLGTVGQNSEPPSTIHWNPALLTPCYYGQFFLFPALTFSLNLTLLIRTLCMAPSGSVLTGFDCTADYTPLTPINVIDHPGCAWTPCIGFDEGGEDINLMSCVFSHQTNSKERQFCAAWISIRLELVL